VYVDLRPPNVRVPTTCAANDPDAWLIDYDDIAFASTPIRSFVDFREQVRVATEKVGVADYLEVSAVHAAVAAAWRPAA